MSPVAEQTEQAAAEPNGPAGGSPPATEPVAPSTERKGLASFHDALRDAAHSGAADPEPTSERPPTPAGSGEPGHSADDEASTPRLAERRPAPTEPAPASAEDGHSADEASTPATDAQQAEPEPAAGQAADRPSRRESATIKTLASERDALKSEVEQLRSALVVPDHVRQAAIDSRLPDDEFERLSDKKKREDVTGDYLTPEESARLTRAIQVRDWSTPWYLDANQRASAWVATRERQIQLDQAEALAPVLQEADYLKPEPLARAASWSDVYRYIRDESYGAGLGAGRAEVQPKLDEAMARVAELETELKGFRHASVGRSRPLERGGISGGAVSARPDPRTASPRDLFAAAEQEAAERRARRAS